MEIQKYCVFLPFTLFSVARHCSKNDLCSHSLNLFFMVHFSLKVLSILRFFQFASSLWVGFCPGQSGVVFLLFFFSFVCLFCSFLISFFKIILETQNWEKWSGSMYVLILTTRYSCFYFLIRTLHIPCSRETGRQMQDMHDSQQEQAHASTLSLPPVQFHLHICKHLLHISPVN